MSSTTPTRAATPQQLARPSRASAQHVDKSYPLWFHIPGGIIYLVLFIVPTVFSFYFAFTRWTLFKSTFIGFENFVLFFNEPGLIGSLKNTLIYGFLTSGSKVVLGMLLAVVLTRTDHRPRLPALGHLLPRPGRQPSASASPSRCCSTRSTASSTSSSPRSPAPTGRAGSPTRTSPCSRVAGDRRLEGHRAGDADLHRRHRCHPERVLRGRPGRRRQLVADVPQHHPAAELPGHHHRHHPVADRRPAVLRPDLDHHPGRARASPPT